MLTRYLTSDTQLIRIEKDPNQPLNLYAGSDNFSTIGEPEGAGMRRNVSFERLWQELIEQSMPKISTTAAKDPAAVLGEMRRWAEDKVDAMRQQKDEELEQYKKEIERAKRFDA
jgi:dynein light intermediate chain 2